MPDTTFEEAKKCPKCGKPGEDAGVRRAPGNLGSQGVTLHTIFCRTELCRWYNTPYYIQVNADGSVPPPRDHTGEPKLYQGFEDHDRIAAEIEAAVRNTDALSRRSGTSEAYEIRNPRSTR
jgi:hypothetical protein